MKYESDYLAEMRFIRKLDVIDHSRVIYGPLDYLGDIGGLTDALTGIGSALIFMIQLFTGRKLD